MKIVTHRGARKVAPKIEEPKKTVKKKPASKKVEPIVEPIVEKETYLTIEEEN